MDQSTVLGIAAIVATFVFLDVLFVEGGDVDRMVAALARIPTIVRRGEAALTALNVIRGSLR
jgi:hypothetical protein